MKEYITPVVRLRPLVSGAPLCASPVTNKDIEEHIFFEED